VKLTSGQEALLEEVVRKRDPSLLRLVGSLGEAPLDDEQREPLFLVLRDELVDTGLLPDYEPNERGAKLGELLDLLPMLGIPTGPGALEELWRRIDLGVAVEQEKIEAAVLAGKSEDLRHVARLLRLLKDEADQVRYYALHALFFGLQQRDKDMEKRCWELLREDPDEDGYVRSLAASCLGSILFGSRSRKVFHRLLGELNSPRQPPFVKGAVYDALFEVVGLPPAEWPSAQEMERGSRKVFEESDIDWSKVTWLEGQLDAE
jgi:hypothetical protein